MDKLISVSGFKIVLITISFRFVYYLYLLFIFVYADNVIEMIMLRSRLVGLRRELDASRDQRGIEISVVDVTAIYKKCSEILLTNIIYSFTNNTAGNLMYF